MRHLKTRLTYANVMSTIAVFLVLGGGAAFAASKIGSAQLKPNAVTAAKIKNGAVTGPKLASGAVSGEKIKAGSVDASKLAADARPTSLAALSVAANGTIRSATPDVQVVRVLNGAYCIGLPFNPIAGSGSTTTTASVEVTIPAAQICEAHPGFQSASVLTAQAGGAIADENWTALFR